MLQTFCSISLEDICNSAAHLISEVITRFYFIASIANADLFLFVFAQLKAEMWRACRSFVTCWADDILEDEEESEEQGGKHRQPTCLCA